MCIRDRWYNVPRAPMPDGKRCKISLGLEPSRWAGSLYVCGIMGPGSLCLMANDVDVYKRQQ